MCTKYSIILLILFISTIAVAEDSERFPLGYSSHALIKEKIKNGDTVLQNDLIQLIRDADIILKITPPSVLDDMSGPNDGNPNDYVSYAPYWWPNPDTKSGLPYVRRDGVINKELRGKGDDKIFTKMALSVHILSMAYYYTDEEKYAIHAEQFLSTWFLDSLTKMNPNVNGGQIIPGKRDHGRRAGINEMRFLTNVIDGVALISNSQSWTTEKNKALEEWFSQYFQWLIESDHGKEEILRPNNHGTWYDVQYVSIALYLRKYSLAQNLIEMISKDRIKNQISADGMQPLEVTRGFSLHYSIYNIKAFFALATLAERVGIDLWNYEAENGASIQLALDYVIPYIGNQESWPHKDHGRGHKKNWFVLLSQAVNKYKSEKYITALELAGKNSPDHYDYCYRLVVQ
jgi:hypothetical protein